TPTSDHCALPPTPSPTPFRSDDNCDGAIDESGCVPIKNCLDDAVCGAFVCTLSEDRASTECRPKNIDATTAAYRPCSEGSECERDRKSTRLNSSHQIISYAVF